MNNNLKTVKLGYKRSTQVLHTRARFSRVLLPSIWRQLRCSLFLLRCEFGCFYTLFLSKDVLLCYNRIKCVVYLLRKRRCRHEFENDRKCRKETKERRKVREGWKHSSGMECVPEILNVCVPRVYKSESGSVLPGRCFLQCNLSLWWNVWTTSDSTRAPDSLNIQL